MISATRMRILIDDLLLFWHTNKKEKVFKNRSESYTKRCTIEFSTDDRRKNAIIKAASMPELIVIPSKFNSYFKTYLVITKSIAKNSEFQSIRLIAEGATDVGTTLTIFLTT